MMVRGFFRLAAGAVIVVGGLSACGSSDDQSDDKSASTPKSASSSPYVIPTCTTNEPWSAVPNYLRISLFAQPLGVPESSIKNGLLGLADCDKPIKMNTIGSLTEPPIVAVKDRGPKCLVVGTQENPRNATTTKIMAVCPSDGTAANKV